MVFGYNLFFMFNQPYLDPKNNNPYYRSTEYVRYPGSNGYQQTYVAREVGPYGNYRYDNYGKRRYNYGPTGYSSGLD